MKDWANVVAYACALPDVEEGTTYGKPAVKLRGKMLAATTAPDPGSFVLHVPLDQKEVLLETDPETFWETDHYRGWPAVLVRYGTPARDRIGVLIQRAWWDRASLKQRAARGGDRP
ncbi:MmcQ/YjbR family DNA-binding protein [Sphingomonas radiodurans]|uniref:MmcQ/YjbR family DNA-binding protein n=1 Tax=Sphingomonas radiodurans TaxID=2890321 RepID=UPI001E53AF2B|nr:MmcQ/YjbR family DNA-binding protein [Sphingomonas radiodurans]WBH16727.1 MmcQ/YjbR family DNA-binding protein [Sphingomonas radiodurans]